MGEVQPRAVMTPEAQVVLEQRIVAWKKAGFDTAEPFFDVKTSVVTERHERQHQRRRRRGRNFGV
jgi:hypothetical protein